MGYIPIMLRSMACHLHGLSPAELVKRGEHEQEWGGYFIVGGHERLIRMLQTTRLIIIIVTELVMSHDSLSLPIP